MAELKAYTLPKVMNGLGFYGRRCSDAFCQGNGKIGLSRTSTLPRSHSASYLQYVFGD